MAELSSNGSHSSSNCAGEAAHVGSAVTDGVAPAVSVLEHDTRVLDVLCRAHTAAASAAGTSAPAASPDPYVLILLNQPLAEFFKPLWENAAFRVCADGGTNRLYDFYASDEERAAHLPDLIVGDLDSARPEVLEFYARTHQEEAAGNGDGIADTANAGPAAAAAGAVPSESHQRQRLRKRRFTLLRRDPDQDSTDLDKALAWIMRAEAAVKRRVRRKMKQQQQQELLQQQQPREAQATSIAVAAGSATDVPASAQIVAPVPVSAAAVAAAAALAALSPSPPPATPSPAGIEQWGPACCVDAAATCAAADVADANGSFVDCATHGGGGQSSSSSNHLASSLSPSAYAFFSSSSVSLRSLPVLLYPSFGGRFDQQTAILNALARHAHALPHAVMLSEGNLARVLMPTTPAAIPAAADPAAAAATAAAAPAVAPVVPLHHRLLVHPCLEQGHHCGLFPLSSPASRVSTSGLQWNLSDQSLAWGPGGLLSTSNRILRGEEVVTVRTDAALVWTSEIKHAKRTRTQQQQQQQQPPQPLQQ